MTGSNFSGSFKQTAERIRLDLAARRKLKQRIQLLRILHRSLAAQWATPAPQRSDPR